MLKKSSLLLASLATVLTPTLGSATPVPNTIPPTSSAISTMAEFKVPNHIRVNPTIMGKIDKPASIACKDLMVAITKHAPGAFPEAGAAAVISTAGKTRCTYKVQVPQSLLGQKVYLWGDLKNPSPLVSVNPVGWNNPFLLPQQLGIVQNYNFVVKEIVIH